MWGTCSEADKRGVSEIYGTVIIISLTFVMAIFLAGIGYYVIGDITSDTEDRISQDSMQELNDRISEVSGSPTDATTTFEFPQGAESIEADEESGSVNITVESSRLSADYLKGSSTVEYDSFDLGTLTFESNDGTIYGLQGGGQWEDTDGTIGMVSPPPFDYDGESLNLGFTSLRGAGSLSPEGEATIYSDSDESIEASNRISEVLENVWTVQPEGLEPVGSDLVDVEIEIESEFAEGWAQYAENELEETPSNVSYENGKAIIEFVQVGTELPEDVESAPSDWDSDRVIYSGNSSHAIFNQVIEPAGSGFVINETATKEDDNGVLDLTDDGTFAAIGIPNPDEPTELQGAITTEGEKWLSSDSEEFSMENNEAIISALINQLIPHDHDIVNSANQLEGDEGELYYDLSGGQEICVIAFENQDVTPPMHAEAVGFEGQSQIRDTNVYQEIASKCKMGQVQSELPQLMVNDISLADENDDWDDITLDEDDIEPLDVTVNVTNEGGMGDASVLLEAQTSAEGTDFSPVDTVEVTEINRTETKEVELTWNPGSSELADINMSEELDGETDIRAYTGSDEKVGGSVDVLYEPPPSEYFEIEAGVEATIYDGGIDDGEVVDDPDNHSINTVQDEIEVEVPIHNTGDDDGEQEVTLWYDDGSGNAPGSIESVDLNAGENTTETLEWDLSGIDIGAEEVSMEITTDDDRVVDIPALEDLLSSDFAISLDEEDLSVLEGQSLEIPVTVENQGAIQDTQEITVESEDIDQSGTSEITVDNDDEDTTTIDLETDVGDASDEVEIEVRSEDRMLIDTITVHSEPEIEDELPETIPTDWDRQSAEDDGLDGSVENIVDYKADWWIEEFSFEWGSCGLFCYTVENLDLELEYALDDPGSAFEEHEYEVNYKISGVGEEIEGFEYKDDNPFDGGDGKSDEGVRESLNDGNDHYDFEVDEFEVGSGDNYFAVEIKIEVLDSEGNDIDDDSVVIPLGTEDDDGEISGSQDS